MICPYCGTDENKVVNSRSSEGGKTIRRRRECINCGNRFTTHERFEDVPLYVRKKNNVVEVFDRSKIIKGMMKAGEKRNNITPEKVEEIVSNIEKSIKNDLSREVSSRDIGEMVLKRLRELDEVAYVRFASVYRDFRDVSEFSEEVKSLLKR